MRPLLIALVAACLATNLAAQDDRPPQPANPAERRADSVAVAEEAREVLDTMQIDGEPTYDREETLAIGAAPWQLSYFPYITGGSNDGPMLAGRVRWYKPAEYEDRVTAVAEVTVDAGIGAQGSRFLTAEATIPRLAFGWRAEATAGAIREARYGFFGIGNDTERDADQINDEQPYYYKVSRNRYLLTGEVTRVIRGPFMVSGLMGVERARFATLPGPSVFQQTFGEELSETDVLGRLALLYDTRDNEYNPHNGVLLELGAQAGSSGGNYTRLYATARGYRAITPRLLLAGRVLASGMDGSPSLNSMLFIPLWENPLSMYGGAETNRGIDRGRYAGPHALFTNLEVRYDLRSFGDFGALTLLGFVDAGRVFADEFELTFDGMHVGAGGGVAFRLLRSTVFSFTLARGSDGAEFNIDSGWMF